MKKYLFALFMLCLSFGLRAQTVTNFIASPSSVPLNGTVHIDYDFQNTSSTNITGNIDTHVSVNSLDLGVINTYVLTSPLLPTQSVHISFDVPADAAHNFNAQSDNIIIIWPTGTFAYNGTSDPATVYVSNPN
ncbi:MAG: hypothetical protein ACTHJ0_12125 [Flavipsychrobacter sp.]